MNVGMVTCVMIHNIETNEVLAFFVTLSALAIAVLLMPKKKGA